MIIAVHILSILFAIFNGRHDVPAVDAFTDHGSAEKPQSMFHRNNLAMKSTFVFALFIIPVLIVPFSFEGTFEFAIAAIAGGLDVWIVFDPVVALVRSNKQAAFYLSNNSIDRRLKQWLGKNAGVWKSLICAGISISITVYLLTR